MTTQTKDKDPARLKADAPDPTAPAPQPIAKPASSGEPPRHKTEEPPVPSIKVRATQAGFYIGYREPGDEFLICSEEEFSDVWMEKPDEVTPQRETDARRIDRERQDRERQEREGDPRSSRS